MIKTLVFLLALFGRMTRGVIEVRVIEDKKRGQLVERRWYEGAEMLAQAIEHLNTIAEANAAGIFFGVLPRVAIGQGTSEDVLPGLACWVDLDFRDFPGCEAEVRRVLDAFPVPPSIVVRTGHGVHAYWLFREPTAPAVLSTLAKRLGVTLHGDHVADAARILRLPGSWNRKDPSAPIEVVVEHFHPERRYNPSDLEEHLLPLDEETKSSGEAGDGAVKIGERLSPRVIHVLDQNPRLQALFEGRGKTAVDDRGRRLDTSSSGYDYSIVRALIQKGITDESELATVLWLRPDGAAQAKGIDYILHTIWKARADFEAGKRKLDPEAEAIDFTVQHVRVYASNPRKYELLVDGVVIELTSGDLLSPGRFRLRFLDAVGKLPVLPRGRVFHAQVTKWLEGAEVVEQPPEASLSEFLRDEIQRVIGELRVGENVADLDRGMALLHNGALVFKTNAIHRRLRESYREVEPGDICSHLQGMGYVWRTPHIDGKGVRVWSKPHDPTAGDSEGAAT